MNVTFEVTSFSLFSRVGYVVVLSLNGWWNMSPKWQWSHLVVLNSLWPHQAPPSMGFPRQEYWSGLSFPSPGDLSNPGIEPRSPALQEDALTSEPPGKPSKSSMEYSPNQETNLSLLKNRITLWWKRYLFCVRDIGAYRKQFLMLSLFKYHWDSLQGWKLWVYC